MTDWRPGARVALLAALVTGGAACSDRCEGSLGEVGRGCAATYDGTPESLSCGANGAPVEVRFCGPLTAVVLNGGFTVAACYYDRGTTRLVGASRASDDQEFCGHSSFTQSAGVVATDPCFWGPPDITLDCPGPAPAAGP